MGTRRAETQVGFARQAPTPSIVQQGEGHRHSSSSFTGSSPRENHMLISNSRTWHECAASIITAIDVAREG